MDGMCSMRGACGYCIQRFTHSNLGICLCVWEDNIKIDVREIVFGTVDYIKLIQDNV
jgi:hypothetical protein